MFSEARSSGRPSRLSCRRSGDKLVDRGADLVDRAQHDVGRHVRVAGELPGVGEGLDQAFLGHHRLSVRPQHRLAIGTELIKRNILIQHRMAEAVDDVGKFRTDRRIDMDVDATGDVDGRCHVAREFIEHDVLVFGLGTELGSLEQALAVPLIVGDRCARGQNDARAVPSRWRMRYRRHRGFAGSWP